VNQNETTISGIDALEMLEHGTGMTVKIETPVGISSQYQTRFVGVFAETLLVIEIPRISRDEYNLFFREGFWMTIRTIATRGEGATLTFKAQIENVVDTPIALFTVTYPRSVQLSPLRSEARFDVNLPAKIYRDSQQVECEIRDLSKEGCAFIVPLLSPSFKAGNKVSLELTCNISKDAPLGLLQGTICNLHRSKQYAKYGVRFDEDNIVMAKSLLSRLQFNGSKLVPKH